MTLKERYAQPWRHFHTWEHVERVHRAAAWYYARLPVPIAVSAAIRYHDAVYISGATDNEEKSAQLYVDERPMYVRTDMVTQYVKDTILATKLHLRHFTPHTLNLHNGRNVMLSCDLVSLAAPWDVFKQDARNVCKEYLYAYEESKVRAGRIDFYEKMLQREYIYPHPHFERTHGPHARVNLYRALLEGKAGVM